MSKSFFKLILALTFLFIFLQPLYASSIKILTLKDGSIIKGKVLQLSNGIYTIATSQFGNVEIPEDNILSIAVPNTNTQKKNSSSQQTQLKNQVQQLQGNILSNPQLIQDIQNMAQDKEIMKILSDQNLINDVMSYDQNKMEKNAKLKELMKNPKIQKMMNRIEQQIGQ